MTIMQKRRQAEEEKRYRDSAVQAPVVSTPSVSANAQTLTEMEASVLEALLENAQDCSGGDFACTEEVDVKSLGMTKQQFGAILTTLQTKRRIDITITYVNGDRKIRVTQVEFR